MEKYRFYICDDSDEFREIIEGRIKIALSGVADCDIVSVSDGESLVRLYAKEMPDAVFLDIDMPELNGFETANELQKLNENACIIFVTSYEDRVYESWNYTPFWFIRKSHLADLDNVLYKLVKKLQAKRLEKSTLRLNSENRAYEFGISDLISFESDGHYVTVHSKNAENIRIRSRISDIEAQLVGLDFVRVNRGVIINLREVSVMSSKSVILHNGATYSIGRDRTAEVKQAFLKYTRGENI